MIVVNPDNTSHTISLVPRFDIEPTEEAVLDFVVTDNFKSSSSSVDNTFDIQDGKIVITFDYDFKSESRYDLAITYTNTLEVIYRGTFIATTQNTQEYKLTKDKFYY